MHLFHYASLSSGLAGLNAFPYKLKNTLIEVKRPNVIHTNYLKPTNTFMDMDYPVKDFIFLRTLDLNSHMKRVQKRILNWNTLSE